MYTSSRRTSSSPSLSSSFSSPLSLSLYSTPAASNCVQFTQHLIPILLPCCSTELWSTMTETESRSQHGEKRQNGDAATEVSTVEDVFDDTFKNKDGPKPPRIPVWRNIILMSLLHVAALYGLTLAPSASAPTLVWSEYYCHNHYFLWFLSVLSLFLHCFSGRLSCSAFCRPENRMCWCCVVTAKHGVSGEHGEHESR